MKKLSEIIHQEVSQGRRDFLTFSSMSLLGLAASSVFPTPVKAAFAALNSGTLAELDGINFYVVGSDQRRFDLPLVNFGQETDEAQYLAQVMFQELMKFEFKVKYSQLSEALGHGMAPNDSVLAMSNNNNSVYNIYSRYPSYFTDNMVEYVSGLLQNSYSKQKDVTVANRKLYNSWDMVKVNANIKQAEKGTQFKEIMDELYAVATSYCQNGKLNAYNTQTDGQKWARQLIAYYNKNEVLDALISSFKVQEVGRNSSFEMAMRQVYNTINKVRALNISSGRHITEDELQEFERTLAGSVYTGFAMNTSWGQQSEQYTVLANRRNFDDVVKLLRNDSGNQISFWISFFTQHSPDSFWNELNNMGLRTSTLQDEGARQRILRKYPDLARATVSVAPTAFSGVVPADATTDSFLSVFTLLLGVGNFTWLTATDRDELSNPVSLMGLAAAFIDTGLNLIKLGKFLDNVTMFIYGSGAKVGIGKTVAEYMAKFSQYLSNLVAKGKHLTNVVERQVANKMFLATAPQSIGKVIDICFVGLAALGAALAAYSLYEAVQGGDVGDIIFASINMLVATVALGVSVAALIWSTSAFATLIAGPLGVIIAVIGIVVTIAQWIYTLLKKEDIKPAPIATYTTEFIKPRGLEYEDLGSYLCRAKSFNNGNMVCAMDAKTMNTDWDNVKHIVDHNTPLYHQAGALVTSSRTGKIYNFANIKQPGYENISNFFTKGATTSISNWRPDYELTTCDHAVESNTRYSRKTAAIFIARVGYDNARIFLTSNLEDAPTRNNELTREQLGLEWQEYPLDVVAINDLEETMFLIFTTLHIYQVRDGVVRRIISDFVGQPNAPITSRLTALALGTNVNLIYRLGGVQEPENRYHYLLTRDDYGDYTSMTLLRTINAPMSSDSPIVGRLFNKVGELVSRMDFMYHDGKSGYVRYGAIMNNTGGASLSLHNGVEFQVPDNGFYFFYKNAFIPR
ncbi:hypothetical protein [Aeromonas popoffii]|uniref:hypothetical protein n=1 Tax=Aeromonas popoffii TaxID=70856 RepID=UPI0005A942F1|nr:hypothetical protein [Aeromonas popoffii]